MFAVWSRSTLIHFLFLGKMNYDSLLRDDWDGPLIRFSLNELDESIGSSLPDISRSFDSEILFEFEGDDSNIISSGGEGEDRTVRGSDFDQATVENSDENEVEILGDNYNGPEFDVNQAVPANEVPNEVEILDENDNGFDHENEV